MTAITTLPPRSALAAARFWAITRTPYFAQAIYSLVPRQVPNGTLSKNGTFAVSAQGIMLYEPAALARWTTPEAGSVLIHEVMHWLREHSSRCKQGGFDPKIFNLAGDCEINDDLQAMKLPMPDGGGVLPSTYGLPINKTAEEYYHAIQQIKKKQEEAGGEDAANAEPDSMGSGGCGGCAGNPNAAEPEDDVQGRTQSDVVALKQATALAVNEHARQHGAGSVPMGMARWAAALTTPAKVAWQQKLATLGRSAVARAGATDYTFNRVSRRQAGYGFGVGKMIAPALISRQPSIVVALDTSGSMGTAEINRAVTEADAIMRSIGAAIHLIACDCQVHTTLKVKNIRELLAQIKGGGGTDFRPVFEELGKMRPTPDVLIFITDGGGWAPEFPPIKTKVIWLLVGAHRSRPYVPSPGSAYKHVGYGDFIEVDETGCAPPGSAR